MKWAGRIRWKWWFKLNKANKFKNYKIENNNINQVNNSICLSFKFSNLIKLEGRYKEEDKLIIYTLERRNFYCYLITISGKYYSFKEIGAIPEIIQENNNKYSSYIKCDSVEGINFMSIY